jgi:type II secretory pathway pseudopilin PulG
LTSAFSRIEASKSAATLRVSDAFKNEDGAFDLPSILVGVVVVGVLTAGVLASIFGVIPFAQDKGAEQNIGAITTAQGVYKAQGAPGIEPGTTFGNLAALQGEKLISADVKDVTSVGDNDEWGSVAKSGSGKFFVATSKNSTPKAVDAAITTEADALATVWDATKAGDATAPAIK